MNNYYKILNRNSFTGFELVTFAFGKEWLNRRERMMLVMMDDGGW